MQAVCKYAEEQREDRAVPVAALIRLGMGMVSRMQMHQMLEDKHTQKDRLVGDVIDSWWFKQSLYFNFAFIFRLYFNKCEDFPTNDSLCQFLWRDYGVVFYRILADF